MLALLHFRKISFPPKPCDSVQPPILSRNFHNPRADSFRVQCARYLGARPRLEQESRPRGPVAVPFRRSAAAHFRFRSRERARSKGGRGPQMFVCMLYIHAHTCSHPASCGFGILARLVLVVEQLKPGSGSKTADRSGECGYRFDFYVSACPRWESCVGEIFYLLIGYFIVLL